MVTHSRHLRPAAARKPLPRDLGGFAQTNDARQILGSSPPLPLVAAAIKERLNESSLLQEESSGALRGVKFMPGDGERIASNLGHIDRRLPRSLDGVGMEENISLLRDLADLFHWLQDTGFV